MTPSTHPRDAHEGTAGARHGCRREYLDAHPRSVARARGSVTAFAAAHGASRAQCGAIALAVSEAVANAIVHAYGGGDDEAVIELRTWIDDQHLIALVRDDGVGMGRAQPSAGLGLGIALMAGLSERLTVESLSGSRGTRVQMAFCVG